MTSRQASSKRFDKKYFNPKRIGGTVALILVLGACSSPATDQPVGAVIDESTSSVTNDAPFATDTSPTADMALVNAITVADDAAGQPQLVFPIPSEVSETTLRLHRDGTGKALHNGQIVTLHVATWRGDNGELLFSTWEDDSAESFVLGSGQFQIINDALQGKHVGAQLIIANPTTFENESYTVFSIFEVINAVEPRAVGAPIVPDANLPAVTLAANGEPSIDIPAGFQPSDELMVQTLIQGDGALVQPDSMITIHYTGWLLDGEVFDSSWNGNPAVFPLRNLIAGWREGLAGQRVGSQVLLVVPPELGYGDSDIPGIPGGSTLVFVVDILNAN